MANNGRRYILSMGTLGLAGLAFSQTKPTTSSTDVSGVAEKQTTSEPDFEIKNDRPHYLQFRDKAKSLAKIPKFSLNPAAPLMKRIGSDQSEWSALKKIVQSDLKPTESGSLSGKLSKRYSRIDRGFQFRHESADTDFSIFHIEPLIDQAADLLDRGLRDRTTWDELGAKWTELTLELNEFIELDEIHQQEEAAGLYEVPAKQSYADYLAESLTYIGADWSSTVMNSLMNTQFTVEKINEISSEAQKVNWLSGLAPYSFGEGGFNGYYQHTFNGIAKTVAVHMKDAAFVQSISSLLKERSFARVQQSSIETLSDSSEARKTGFEARYNWDFSNTRFMRERTLVARRLQELKTKLATDPDGLLNYAKRLDSLQQRFHADFRSAFARLKVVQEGLRIVYNYNVPLPLDEQRVNFFDDCLLWCRSAIQWLIRFSRMEQSVIFPISLRSIIGDDSWYQGLQTGQWSLPITQFQFDEMKCVRVRGISATVSICTVNERHRLWQLAITPPKRAKICHLDNTTINIDQSRIPMARLYRVATRDNRREPDVVGVSAWFNISPIGDWHIKGVGSVPYSGGFSLLDDIFIDLIVSYRSEK